MDLGTNTPNYTDYVDNYDYYSGSIAFNPEGMAGLYKLTENFLNSLLPPNFLKEGMLVWTKSGNDEYYPALSQDFSYTDLFRDYWNVILVLVFIAFLSILIPIIGLIFSCCRCCGNCGAKAKPSNKKSDFYWKIILAIFLIACCAIFLFGVVSAFASNQQMQRGTNEFPNNIRNVYKDSVSYLQSTNDHAALLLSDNFREFKDALVAIIQASGKNFMEQIPIWANMSIINDIVNFAEALPDIQANLSILQQSTANLKDEGTTAVNGLNKLKVDITTTLSACSSLSQCKEMSQEINELKLNVDFSQLPNIDSAVTQMSGLDSTNILIAARTVKANVDTIQNNISTILTTTLNNVSEQVDTAGDTIVDNLRILTDVVHNLTQDMNDLNTTLETGYRYLNEYYPYFYYVGLTIACVLLLIIVFMFFGILLGIFAVRPEEGKKNCCTKNSASYFLMIGAVLIFLFTLFVGIITLVMLIVGTAVDRGICYPLRNPEDSTLISFIDEYLNITDQSGMNLQVNKILKNCFQNESIYNVFELKSKFDIDNLSSEFDVNSTIDTILKSIRDNLDSIFPSNNIILSTNDLNALNTLIAVNPDIQLPIFESQLNQEFSSQNLTILAQSLQTVANAIQPIQPTVSEQIIAHVMEVETYNKNVLQPLISHATNTLDLAKTLDTQMKMNSTSFSEAIANFIKDVQTAQDQLNIDRDNIFEKASLDFGELIKELIYGYMNRVISVTKDDLGQCGPLSVAFNATLITVCDNIALPWNGFWVSLFMGFMTFVPILIISIWLASLYKRYKPSEQQFGREHDNYKNKNKKGKNGNDFKDYYQRDIPSHGDFYNNGSSNQNFNDYINDRRVNNPYNPRYDDMAPKFSRYPQESTRF